eukprot:3782652-Prymnesium_polylepis.1
MLCCYPQRHRADSVAGRSSPLNSVSLKKTLEPSLSQRNKTHEAPGTRLCFTRLPAHSAGDSTYKSAQARLAIAAAAARITARALRRFRDDRSRAAHIIHVHMHMQTRAAPIEGRSDGAARIDAAQMVGG